MSKPSQGLKSRKLGFGVQPESPLTGDSGWSEEFLQKWPLETHGTLPRRGLQFSEQLRSALTQEFGRQTELLAEEYQKNLAALEGQSQTIQDQFRALQSKYKHLQESSRQQEQELLKLEAEGRKQRQSRDQRIAELEEKCALAKQQEHALIALQEQHEQLQSLLQQQRQEAQNLSEQLGQKITDQEQKIQELEQQLYREKAQHKQILDAAQRQLVEERGHLQTQVHRSEQRILALEKQLDEMEKNYVASSAPLLMRRVEQLEEQLLIAEQLQKRERQLRMQDCERQASDFEFRMSQERGDADRRLAAVEKRAATLQSDLAAEQGRFLEIQSRYQMLKASEQRNRACIEALESQIRTLQVEHSRTLAQLKLPAAEKAFDGLAAKALPSEPAFSCCDVDTSRINRLKEKAKTRFRRALQNERAVQARLGLPASQIEPNVIPEFPVDWTDDTEP